VQGYRQAFFGAVLLMVKQAREIRPFTPQEEWRKRYIFLPIMAFVCFVAIPLGVSFTIR